MSEKGPLTQAAIDTHNNAYMEDLKHIHRSTEEMEDEDDEPIITVEPERPRIFANDDAQQYAHVREGFGVITRDDQEENIRREKKLKKKRLRKEKAILFKKTQRMRYLNTVVKYWRVDPNHITSSIRMACCDEEETKYITSNIEDEEQIVPGDIPRDDTIEMLYGHMDRSPEQFIKLKNEQELLMGELSYVCAACKLIPDKINKKRLFRCTLCKKAWYCDGTCQLVGWKEHKKVCNK